MKELLSPDQILDQASTTYTNKARANTKKLLILSIIAGAFIAFAAQGSTFASFNLVSNSETLGLGKLVTGITFTPGLILVLVAGAELFTGNNLMIIPLLDKQINIKELLRAWAIVYIGNLIGSILIAFLMFKSGQWNSANAALAGRVILTANAKVNLSFTQAFIMGILCNRLVCAAVWMALGSDTQVGKILSAFFPIMLFVVSGFEHSVANMYYIPAGIFAKSIPQYVEASGLSIEALSGLNRGSFFTVNLIPVTLGNIIGGGLFVATAYRLSYRNKKER